MVIEFPFNRREALGTKSESFKKYIRKYLEIDGFSQIGDSSVEGIFKDMIFYNPIIAPGKEFVIEAKATDLSIRNKKFARELVHYYKLWNIRTKEEKFIFMLFINGVKKPSKWKKFFDELNDIDFISEWCKWFNTEVAQVDANQLNDEELPCFRLFLQKGIVKVINSNELLNIIIEKENITSTSITRASRKLIEDLEKRKKPIPKNSEIIFNLAELKYPEFYYKSKTNYKRETTLYKKLDDAYTPPFIIHQGCILSYSNIANSDLGKHVKSKIIKVRSNDLKNESWPIFSRLLFTHLRRIFWKRGVFRVTRRSIFYYPFLEENINYRYMKNWTGRNVIVVKKVSHLKDTRYHKKGDINHYLHKAVNINLSLLWGCIYVTFQPRFYITFDGKTPIDGETLAKIVRKYRNPRFNRGKTRINLIKLWKYLLFDSYEYEKGKEDWFDNFHLYEYYSSKVSWSPEIVSRPQSLITKYLEEENA